jgi:RHS repeat-associated protein
VSLSTIQADGRRRVKAGPTMRSLCPRSVTRALARLLAVTCAVAFCAPPAPAAHGNTLTGGGRTNTWDGQNRLTQCVFGGTTTTHTYGSDGLRRRTVQGATTTDYVLMGDSVVRELRAGATHATYLHGPRGPEYRRDAAGNARWYLYDGLGSVLGEVDAAGNVTATRKLDVYGAVRASTGTATSNHAFVGSLGHPSEAETGLVYMRARYYDPVLGRFASEDPAGDGVNWFGYASCAPTRLVDRAGESPEGEALFQYLWMLADVVLLQGREAHRLGKRWIVHAETYQLQALATSDPMIREGLKSLSAQCFNVGVRMLGRAAFNYFFAMTLRASAALVLIE